MKNIYESLALPTVSSIRSNPKATIRVVLVAVLFCLIYWRVFRYLYYGWTEQNSYYTHGFIVPFISLYFAYKQSEAIRTAKVAPSSLGYPLIIGASITLLLGDFLGFTVFSQLSLIPMLAGLIIILWGKKQAQILWFPLIFLFFMIPIPSSLTQSIALHVKLLATASAVGLAQLLTLPVIQDGSFVHFGDDQLLVGEVCGGLRSLVALLAFGTLMSYISKTRTPARLLILLISGPVAVVSNIMRIFFLCVVAYFWGSEMAVGRVHDVSGILIFAVAFALMFTLESYLRKFAPQSPRQEERS